MGAGPKYPNQQLQSVSLETFFAGTLNSLASMARIQDANSALLPDLYVPNVVAGEPLMLRAFQLRDKMASRSLALALNQASFISFQYPGYDAFSQEALPILASCLKELGVAQLTRVVYRYENALSIARGEHGTLDALTRAFPKLSPSVFDGRAVRQLDSSVEVAFSGKVEGVEVHGGEGFRVQVDPGPIEILRVFVHAMVERTAVASLEATARLVHDHAVTMFEGVISEGFRTFLRGDDGSSSKPS
jgi:uncharacterized protein (TIGR04255 family)